MSRIKPLCVCLGYLRTAHIHVLGWSLKKPFSVKTIFLKEEWRASSHSSKAMREVVHPVIFPKREKHKGWNIGLALLAKYLLEFQPKSYPGLASHYLLGLMMKEDLEV